MAWSEIRSSDFTTPLPPELICDPGHAQDVNMLQTRGEHNGNIENLRAGFLRELL